MRPVPGDEAFGPGYWYSDHSVKIKSKASDIWPWLVQMGNGRAGWYSYDWIDNLGKQSLKFIDPNLQNLNPGDHHKLFEVEDLQINSFLTLRFTSNCNMTWFLEEFEKETVLLTRVRLEGIPHLIANLLLEPAHSFMQKKQFREIKRRVET